MSTLRPVFAEIDLDALAENTSAMRTLAGPEMRFYGVVKGDAYGTGLLRAVPVILEAGADAIATADPADVPLLRNAGVSAPILLYPSTAPSTAREVVELGVIVTLHDLSSIKAFAAQPSSVTAHVKIDCGFGRLGLQEGEWGIALDAIRDAQNIRVVGLYTHLGHTESPEQVHHQMSVFERAVSAFEAGGVPVHERMVASTRVAIGYPEYHLNAINPGRGLYGILDTAWLERFNAKRALHRLWTEVLQVKWLPAGASPGYTDGPPLEKAMKIAVLAIGFASGLPRVANGMPVLIRGKRAPTVGLRSTDHTVIDVTHIPDVQPGDEAVIIGAQAGEEILMDEFAGRSELPLIEIHGKLIRGTTRDYSRRSAGREYQFRRHLIA